MHNLGDLPSLWEQHVHPDGKPYFCHPQRNIVTEANIRDQSVLMKLENWYNLIISTKSTDKDVEASSDWELYLTLDPNGYYYVDHANQSVYWLQDIHLSMLPIDSNSSFGTLVLLRLLWFTPDGWYRNMASPELLCSLGKLPVSQNGTDGRESFTSWSPSLCLHRLEISRSLNTTPLLFAASHAYLIPRILQTTWLLTSLPRLPGTPRTAKLY